MRKIPVNDKVKVIGICYIVYGLLGVLGLPSVYALKLLVDFAFADMGTTGAQAQAYMGIFEDVMAVVIPALVLLTISHIVFNVLVGICFIKRKAYYTCLITSILTCLVVPLGTLLGVFALMALIDEETKRQFKKLKA